DRRRRRGGAAAAAPSVRRFARSYVAFLEKASRGQLRPELPSRVVQGLVERAARGVETLGEHVDRHIVQRERGEHGALVRSELLAHRALQRTQELGGLAA